MPTTIKDIAKRAGVSHGTVSNVLNKRGNVSAEKINLVEQAARELGYSINAQAKQLRQGRSKRVCVVIPNGNSRRYIDLISGINMEIKKNDYEVDIYFTEDRNYEEKKVLEHIISQKPLAVIIVSSFTKNMDIFNCGIPFVFVEREIKNLPENAVYAGFDYYEAGREIAGKCAADGVKNVAIFSESNYFSSGRKFAEGIKEVLEETDICYSCVQSADTLNLNSAFELQNTEETYDAIITDCIERAELLKSVWKFTCKDSLPVLYSLDNKQIQIDDTINRYELNYKLCGKQIAEYILKIQKRGEASQKILKMKNDGFLKTETLVKVKEKTKLNFLSLASPTMRALRYLLPDFERQTGITVNLVEAAYDELQKAVSKMDSRDNNPYDLIRIDMVWLSQYAEKIFKPVSLEKQPYADICKNFSNVFLDEYFKAGDVTYVLPFDPSVQILYYRRDLFENALICREFYETYRRQLRIPQNYKEYDEVAKFFTRKFNPNSPTKYGTALVYGSAAVAACDFLPRWREKGGKLLDENGEIQINTPEMKNALEAYVKAWSYSDKSMCKWWKQAMKLFADGMTAMNIGFSNHASTMVLENHSDIAGKVGFSAVPGGKPLLGGGVIGVSRYTEKDELCEKFLRWIYSEKISSTITSLGGYINHKNLICNQDILQVYPWIEGMEKAFAVGERSLTKDCCCADEVLLEEIIGEAVRSAVLGVRPIDEILEIMQKKCVELLKK